MSEKINAFTDNLPIFHQTATVTPPESKFSKINFSTIRHYDDKIMGSGRNRIPQTAPKCS